MNAEVETFFVDEPRYHRWLKEHPNTFIARVGLRDGVLAIHRVSCQNASPRDGAPGGMAAVRVCADVRDDLIDWAGPYLATNMTECTVCWKDHWQGPLTAARPDGKGATPPWVFFADRFDTPSAEMPQRCCSTGLRSD